MSKNKKQFLDDLIWFLKNERELYGDWDSNISQRMDDSKSTSGSHKTKSSNNNFPAGEGKKKQHTDDDSSSDTQHQDTSSSVNEPPALFTPGSLSGVEEQLKACKTLDQLQALCEQNNDLKTDLKDTNLVFGVGNPNADLMIIGEAPGYYEDKQGEPFVGKAGKLLNKILNAIHFKRQDVYIANILKHRPPKNRDPKPEERQKSLPYLMRQIDIIQPKLILCLGRVAATTLLEREDSLKNMRGKFHPFRGVELMVTYHPAALLRHQKWKRPTWEDVQLLRERYDELGGTP